MIDKREAIMARLVALGADTEGVTTAARNRNNIAEDERPAMLFLDADEAADQSDPSGRPANAPRFVSMTPEMYILLAGKPENVGTELNTLRRRFLAKVFTDSQLAALVGTTGSIRYEGCATSLHLGRQMNGDMGLSLTFRYVLHPADLAD